MNRFRSDKGSANTVSFIVIVFFVMIMLISFVDVGLYFNVKNEMQAAAENGARNVAIYGGTGGSLRSERNKERPTNPIASSSEIVEESIRAKFRENGSSNMVEVKKISCNPEKSKAGDRVWCEVEYEYVGLAGDFGLFNLGRNNNLVKVTGASVSEVTTNR